MNHSPSLGISQLLLRVQQGDAHAQERIADWLIEEVRSKVNAALRQSPHSTSHSSLISNVLVKLVRSDTIRRAPNVYYLHSAIANATREILIDLWRQRQRRRAMGENVVSSNEALFRKFDETDWNIMEMHEALDLLERVDARKALVVTLRYFCDMTVDQVAEELALSKSTIEADWKVARSWLYQKLKNAP